VSIAPAAATRPALVLGVASALRGPPAFARGRDDSRLAGRDRLRAARAPDSSAR